MVPNFVKYLFVYGAGHTYSNLSRLFLRLFTGVMFMQFGIRQWIHFDSVAPTFIDFGGIGSEASLAIMIAIEIICSTMMILGFMSRISVLPPSVAMIFAETHILTNMVHVEPSHLISTQPGYVPILFLGIFCFMLLAGPGKISLDYLISLRFTHTDKDIENTLKDA